MKIKKFNENQSLDIVAELSKDLNNGLEQFGEYSFYDKGPDEVMDISKYDNIIKDMKIKDIADIFNSFYSSYPEKDKSVRVINSILTGLDNRDDFEEIFDYDTYKIFDY